MLPAIDCDAGATTECAAIAVGTNSSGRCWLSTHSAVSLSNAQSSALQGCRSGLGSTADCNLLVSGCASGAPSTRVWRPSGRPGTSTLPPEPPRTSAPQAPGSDWSGVEIAGVGGTTYVSALNRTSGTVTYQASTWFEPKDGKYQRMIVTQSTSVPPGQVVRIPTACMQSRQSCASLTVRASSRTRSEPRDRFSNVRLVAYLVVRASSHVCGIVNVRLLPAQHPRLSSEPTIDCDDGQKRLQ